MHGQMQVTSRCINPVFTPANSTLQEGVWLDVSIGSHFCRRKWYSIVTVFIFMPLLYLNMCFSCRSAFTIAVVGSAIVAKHQINQRRMEQEARGSVEHNELYYTRDTDYVEGYVLGLGINTFLNHSALQFCSKH